MVLQVLNPDNYSLNGFAMPMLVVGVAIAALGLFVLVREHGSLLLAEDNDAVRTITQIVLSEFGYRVIEAVDGEEALKKFLDNKDTISLLIVDVIMPRKNGRAVYEEVKRIRPEVKVLFTSGYPADLIQKEGVLEKGLNFLSKPSSPQALLRMVREVLDQ